MNPWAVGGRTVLAVSCLRCGRLLSGFEVRRHYRNRRDKRPYVDRRCTDCKWGYKKKGSR